MWKKSIPTGPVHSGHTQSKVNIIRKLMVPPFDNIQYEELSYNLKSDEILLPNLSQWKQMDCLPFPSCFLYNLRFSINDFFCLLPTSCWFHAWLILQPWRWRWHVLPKCQSTFTWLHGIVLQNIELLILMSTAVRI